MAWIHCTDYEENWYEDCDEEAHRAYKGKFPITKPGVYFVHASAAINDSMYPARLGYWGEPDPDKHLLIQYSPQIYLDNKWHDLWHGAVYQFGDKWMEESRALISDIMGDSTIIYITSDPGVLPEDVILNIDGMGYFSAEETVSIRPFKANAQQDDAGRDAFGAPDR